MGKYYLFKVSILGNDDIEQTYKQIEKDNSDYILYNKFLTNHYGTNVAENEDYIAYTNKRIATMILNEDCYEYNDLENVFEILYDNLYMNRGEKFEENNNHKWVSSFG